MSDHKEYIVKYWNQLEEYSPPKHSGTVNRRLLSGNETGDSYSTVFGRIEPGGKAERHKHLISSQLLVILAGTVLVDLDGQEFELGKGDSVYIEPNVPHLVTVTSKDAVELINVYQPPLAGNDIIGA